MVQKHLYLYKNPFLSNGKFSTGSLKAPSLG